MRFPDETVIYERIIRKTRYIITSEVPDHADEDLQDTLLRLMRRDLAERSPEKSA